MPSKKNLNRDFFCGYKRNLINNARQIKFKQGFPFRSFKQLFKKSFSFIMNE